MKNIKAIILLILGAILFVTGMLIEKNDFKWIEYLLEIVGFILICISARIETKNK